MAELSTTSLFADANLKAYYKLESGALTTDSGPNGYTLTNNNTVGEASGKYGICADLGTANTDKSLSIVNDLGITNGAVTMALWIKMRTEISTGTWSLLQHEDAGTSINYQIEYDYNGGTRRLNFRRDKQGVAEGVSNYTVTLGTADWHHVVLTYDTTNLRGYVDGALVAGPTALSGDGTGVAADVFSIGAFRGTVDGFTSAYIDDVGVFNRALTDAEVLTLYTDPEANKSRAFFM